MPIFDGTGPQGNGPLSGRGRGKCNDKKTKRTGDSDNASQTPRFGRGRRMHEGVKPKGFKANQ